MKTLFLCMLFAMLIPVSLQRPVLARAPDDTPAAQGAGGRFLVSAAYSPYRVIEVASEFSGEILEIPAKEGEILEPGHPLVRMDCKAERARLDLLQHTLRELENEEKILSEIAGLREKTLGRYQRLYKEERIPEQTLEDARASWLSAQRALSRNRQQQLEARARIVELEDLIKKANPAFPLPLYVSRIYVEPCERVSAGRPLARLLDVSRARVSLVLPPEDFKRLASKVQNGSSLPFTLFLPQGTGLRLSGRVEKLKEDRASGYLYSYGLDLVFEPVKGLLWGEVVKIGLQEAR